MAHVFEGLDDKHFIKQMKTTYGHLFSEFLASEHQAAREVEKSSSLVDATWGQRIVNFAGRVRGEIRRLRDSQDLTKYVRLKGLACLISVVM